MKEYLDTITTDISNEKVYESYYTLYFMCQDPLNGYGLKDFEYYMESPKRRVEFLSLLNEAFTGDLMPRDLEDAYIELYPILISQAFGAYNKYVYIPDHLSEKVKCDTHNPTNDELEELMYFMKYVLGSYIKYNKGREYTIELPRWSMDKGKELSFRIRDGELPALLGLTSASSGITDWVFQELAKDYPNKVDENGDFEKGFVANNYIPYLYKRMEHLLFINKRVNDYVNKYRVDSPQLFDSHGDIKPKYLESFNKIFKEKFGFNYPLIEYNKVLAKTIAFYNYTNFSCVPEVIVDVDPTRTKDNMKSNVYLGVYRESDVFGFDDNQAKSNTDSIRDSYSNKFLSIFKIDNSKVEDQESLHKVTLIGLKTKREENGVYKVAPSSNVTINLKRLIYKYRFAGRSYYLDKIVDDNGSHVYLGDLESETDYYAVRLNERKEIKTAKKKAMYTIEKYLSYLKSRRIKIEVPTEFRKLIQEKRPSLINDLNSIDNNLETTKSSRLR